MLRAIGLIEFSSIAKGIEIADNMIKAADVEVLISTPVCPGKYFVLVHGDVAAVESSINVGIETGSIYVIDDFILPNVHPSVYPAIVLTSEIVNIQAIGVIESFSIASMIVCADAALKAANVEAIELRLGTGIGGKSFFILSGDVASVQEAVDTGSKHAINRGFLVEQVVIPSPSKKLIESLLLSHI